MTTAFDQLFAAAIAAVFGLYVVRCFAGALLYLCGQLPTRWGRTATRLSAAVTPRLVKRLLAVALGIASAAIGASPALASGLPDLDRAPTRAQQPPSSRIGQPQAAAAVGIREGLIVKSTTPHQLSAGQQAIPAAIGPTKEQPQKQQVRVRRGDCLWSLARQQLAPRATNRQIDQQWRRWYRLNREVIGADPDVVRTGSWLRVPTIPRTQSPSTPAPNLGGVK